MYFSDPAFANAVREVFGKPLRPVVAVANEAAAMPSRRRRRPSRWSGKTRRAGARWPIPEVRRFQEVFEGSTIHKVRNLKE